MEKRELGEQWVEEIEGREHMVKLVEGKVDRANRCEGCLFRNEYKKLCEIPGGAKHISEVGCARKQLIIKDLGILNEYGCLPEEHTGEYPIIKKVVSLELLMWVWWVGIDRKADVNGANLSIGVEALTKQQAIDAWNRRV